MLLIPLYKLVLGGDDNYTNSAITTNVEIDIDKYYKKRTTVTDRWGQKCEINSDNNVGAHSFDVEHPDTIDDTIKAEKLRKLNPVPATTTTPANINTSDDTKKKKTGGLIMNRVIKITYSLFVLWVVLVAVLNLNANIAFGHGLGDIYYLLLLLFLLIVTSIVFFKMKKGLNTTKADMLFLFFVLAIIIAFTPAVLSHSVVYLH